MDTLIIGCGYLGRRVAELWRCQGRRVRATTRCREPAQPATLEWLICDVLDPRTLRNLPRVGTVLYAVGFDRAAAASMRAVYVDGLANVLAHLPLPERFIYISSSSVYGQTGGEWVDEDSPTCPEEESGKIVLDAERVLKAKLPQAVILRFAGIYGPGRLLRQKAIEAGAPIVGDAERWLNLIHVEDGARAVLAAEKHALPGRVYNISDGHPVQRCEFYAELAKQLGAAPPHFVSPPPGVPLPPHEKGNRRVGNRRMCEELRFVPAYERFEEGIRASKMR